MNDSFETSKRPFIFTNKYVDKASKTHTKYSSVKIISEYL